MGGGVMALGLPVAGAAADRLVGALGAAAALPEPADGEVQTCAGEQERCQGAEGGEAPEHGADSLPDDVPDRGLEQERAQVTEAPPPRPPSRGPRIPLYRAAVAALSMWCFLPGPWRGDWSVSR